MCGIYIGEWWNTLLVSELGRKIVHQKILHSYDWINIMSDEKNNSEEEPQLFAVK